MIESLERTVPGTVRVVWSQPTGGAPVTEYIIHYTTTDSSDSADMITGISAGSTSTDITGLTGGDSYTISVEARSGHLSGESGKRTITLGKSQFMIIPSCISCVFIETPEHPEGVMAVVGSASVTVSWEAVADADRYTVTFTRARGDDQQGGCPGGSHTASVSVEAPTTTASVDIGKDIEADVINMLRAYSTYSITVVAVSDEKGSSKGRIQKNITTMQIGMQTVA